MRSASRLSATQPPATDPTSIFEIFRGSYGTELLTAAVAHLGVFGLLSESPLTLEQLCQRLKIQRRPGIVLTTALRAFGLIAKNERAEFAMTPLAEEHLAPGSAFDVGDYVSLAATSPGVVEIVERLRTNRPAGLDGDGAAFIYRDGLKSAMDQTAAARHFTLALAGRAKNVAPILAENCGLNGQERILDVGGGTGIYSIALLQKFPKLQAVVLDHPEVLKVALEMGHEYGFEDRLELSPGDMFNSIPSGFDVILLSNILHDWDEPECQTLVRSCADALRPRGRLLIHDVFLNDALDGPLPIALYSAALFTLTEGRAYSQLEYRNWMTDAGLTTSEMKPTLIHCGVLSGQKA